MDITVICGSNKYDELLGTATGASMSMASSSRPMTPPAQGETAAQRKRRRPRSLLLLLKSLVGLRVRIELKNDCIIEGVVEEVLHDMDFTLLDALETKPNGKRVHFDEVFVMGRTVLYVHIPDRININSHLLDYMRILKQSREMYKRDKRKTPGK